MQSIIYFSLCTIVYFFICYPKWKQGQTNNALNTLFFCYVCIVLFLTLLPVPTLWDPHNFDGDIGNFIPFRDLKYGYEGALKDIVLT